MAREHDVRSELTQRQEIPSVPATVGADIVADSVTFSLECFHRGQYTANVDVAARRARRAADELRARRYRHRDAVGGVAHYQRRTAGRLQGGDGRRKRSGGWVAE